MRFLTALLLGLSLFIAPAGGQSVCGTIDTTGATVEVGGGPSAGTLTIDPCGSLTAQ